MGTLLIALVLTGYGGKSKKARPVGRFADVAQTAVINKEAELARLALESSKSRERASEFPQA